MRTYNYPSHFVHPEGDVYFKSHIQHWYNNMPDLLDKPNVTLEIGVLHGGASVFILDNYCNKNGSHHHIIDPNMTMYVRENLKPYPNHTYHMGFSGDELRTLSHEGATKEFLDLVYIDGSHMAKEVMEDAVLSFYCLKVGGYMVFDDYGWGTENPEHARPQTGIEGFFHAYQKHIEAIHSGWQVIARKIKYEPTDLEKKSNYIAS